MMHICFKQSHFFISAFSMSTFSLNFTIMIYWRPMQYGELKCIQNKSLTALVACWSARTDVSDRSAVSLSALARYSSTACWRACCSSTSCWLATVSNAFLAHTHAHSTDNAHYCHYHYHQWAIRRHCYYYFYMSPVSTSWRVLFYSTSHCGSVHLSPKIVLFTLSKDQNVLWWSLVAALHFWPKVKVNEPKIVKKYWHCFFAVTPWQVVQVTSDKDKKSPTAVPLFPRFILKVETSNRF